MSSPTEKTLAEEFREHPIFAGLAPEDLSWLASQASVVTLEPGQIAYQEGDPADALFVIIEGEVRYQRESAGPNSPAVIAKTGEVGGVLPFSRLTHFPGTVRALKETRSARIPKEVFPELVRRMPDLTQRLVGLMVDRTREFMRREQQREKMMALGKLSAGLAHELNNPSAAIRQAARSLRESLEMARDAIRRLDRHPLTPEQREPISRFLQAAIQRGTGSALDVLARSEREERISGWLEARHAPEPWKIASELAAWQVEPAALESLAEAAGESASVDALARAAAFLSANRLLNEIESCARRISDLIGAVKQYSFMDRGSMQEVDLHDGIESTLTIFSYRLKDGIKVIRDYDRDLPSICASGGDLNQVWTNLIDNALDAMKGKGELRLRTTRDVDRVLVEVGDTGPGIPPEIQSRIFDPFFTTKEVGEGTGLGLDTVMRIVRNHGGDVKALSHPGDTRFQVYLPIQQAREL